MVLTRDFCSSHQCHMSFCLVHYYILLTIEASKFGRLYKLSALYTNVQNDCKYDFQVFSYCVSRKLLFGWNHSHWKTNPTGANDLVKLCHHGTMNPTTGGPEMVYTQKMKKSSGERAPTIVIATGGFVRWTSELLNVFPMIFLFWTLLKSLLVAGFNPSEKY